MEVAKILEFKEEDNKGINGMANLGNTCYLNAAVQCLLRIQPLCDYFLNELHLQEVNMSNKLGTQGKISEAFGDIIQ